MPYVACTQCGLTTYAPPPAVLAADCPECGTRLLEPRASARTLLAPLPPRALLGDAPGARIKSR